MVGAGGVVGKMPKNRNPPTDDKSIIYLAALIPAFSAFAFCLIASFKINDSIEEGYINQISQLNSLATKTALERNKTDELVELELVWAQSKIYPQEALDFRNRKIVSHEEIVAIEQRVSNTIENSKELIGTLKGVDTTIYPHLKRHIQSEEAVLSKEIEIWSLCLNYLEAKRHNDPPGELDSKWSKFVRMMPEVTMIYNESISENKSSIDSILIDQRKVQEDLQTTSQKVQIQKNRLKTYEILMSLLFLVIVFILYKLFKSRLNK